MINQAVTPRQAPSLSLPFIGLSLLLAFVLFLGADVLMFLAYYRDTLTPLPLPYSESFDALQRLDYRQFGGTWQLRDGTLVQSESQTPDLMAVLPLTVAADEPYQFGAHLQILQGPNGGGLLFNLQHADNRQQSHLVRFGNDNGRDYLVFGYFDENLQFVAQGSIPPPDLSAGVDLAVQVHDQRYDVLVNGAPVQQNIPLQYSGGRLALTTWFTSVAFDNVYVDRLGEPAPVVTNAGSIPAATSAPQAAQPAAATPIVPQADAAAGETTLPAAENAFFTEQFAADTDQTVWRALSGDWRFEPGALIQGSPTGFDHSIIRSGTFSRYTVTVRFQQRQGVGGGLLFNLPTDQNETSGHMVRYFEDGNLVWGYFADGVFTGQGYQPVPLPGDEPHTLQVTVGESSYAIRLDDQVVAENVALVSTQGHIGLTASQSVVAFEEVDIQAIE